MPAIRKLLPLLLLLISSPLPAQDAGAYRGAWIADHDQSRYVLYLVFRHQQISGFMCHDCTDPDKLAFVDDGSLDSGALDFMLYHSTAQGTYEEQVSAVLDSGELKLDIARPGTAALQLTMRRAPPRAAPPPIADFRPNQPDPGQPRTLPGAAEQLAADQVLGMWLWGVGPTKQYFFFKRHKDGIRGMVCGPCDSAKDFAPLEQIAITGDNFHFEIVHEDNGMGIEEHGPFSNVTDAKVALNEMHMTTYPSYNPEQAIEMTLLGPVRYMPPAE